MPVPERSSDNDARRAALLALLLEHDAESPDVLMEKIDALYAEALNAEARKGAIFADERGH